MARLQSFSTTNHEKQIAYEIELSNKIELIKQMLDSEYFDGFSDSLSNDEWNFYFDQYKDIV